MEEGGKNVFIAGKFKSIEGTLKPIIYIFNRCKKIACKPFIYQVCRRFLEKIGGDGGS